MPVKDWKTLFLPGATWWSGSKSSKQHFPRHGASVSLTPVQTPERPVSIGPVRTDHIGNDTFFVTYGDGLGNVDLRSLVEFHHAHPGAATVTAVPLLRHPMAR